MPLTVVYAEDSAHGFTSVGDGSCPVQRSAMAGSASQIGTSVVILSNLNAHGIRPQRVHTNMQCPRHSEQRLCCFRRLSRRLSRNVTLSAGPKPDRNRHQQSASHSTYHSLIHSASHLTSLSPNESASDLPTHTQTHSQADSPNHRMNQSSIQPLSHSTTDSWIHSPSRSATRPPNHLPNHSLNDSRGDSLSGFPTESRSADLGSLSCVFWFIQSRILLNCCRLGVLHLVEACGGREASFLELIRAADGRAIGDLCYFACHVRSCIRFSGRLSRYGCVHRPGPRSAAS
jgi:hypothetical protein